MSRKLPSADTEEVPLNELPRFHDDDPGASDTKSVMAVMPSEVPRPRDTLTLLEGLDAGRVFEFSSSMAWIGRDPDCEVRLRDPGVSRRHASLVRRDGSCVLRDGGAKNGTFVNGKRIGEQELRRGDEIQIGPKVSLLYAFASGPEERFAQHRAAREQLLAERMYIERLESIAHVVASVAHEINTPLGVANTATAMIADLVEELARTPSGPQADVLVQDMRQAAALLSRNLHRTSQLVVRFKQLSTSQLSDEYQTCDLASVIKDCIETLSAETRARNVVVRTNWPTAAEFPWSGFPSHLSQLLVGLVQNALRYAYPAASSGGVIDLRLAPEGSSYRIEFEDYGAGIPAEVYPRVFEPFVTTGREFGATGLGLAITHNIVTHLLAGKIACRSVPGAGTRFILTLPQVVPERSTRGSISPRYNRETS